MTSEQVIEILGNAGTKSGSYMQGLGSIDL
jgi:hypothetical protein